jgi:mannose-1-phosphate guanylyltransferase
MSVHPVVMAGGSGTRFWPLSRRKRPKQFLPLVSARPLIAETVARLHGIAPARDVLCVCGKVHAAAAQRLAGLRKPNVLVEPVARNTAPALALASVHVAARAPRGVLIALPADQHIGAPEKFREVLLEAVQVAEQGQIVTIGLTPTRAETGYGYIQLGDPLNGRARRAKAFVEKPDAETARRYVSSGEYLWNGGIFVFRADVMLEALTKHMPQMAPGVEALRAAVGTQRYPGVLNKTFKAWPSISIDYAVAEKAPNMAVIPGDFGWSDVGSFAAVADIREKDGQENVISGKGALVIDSSGCVVLAGDRPVAVIGLKDVVVVDAGDAILVVPKDKSQDVRKAVDGLKARHLERYL